MLFACRWHKVSFLYKKDKNQLKSCFCLKKVLSLPEIIERMTFDKINEKLYAVREKGRKDNVLYNLFEQWYDVKYLYDFFSRHTDVLQSYFHISGIRQAVSDTIEDVEYLEDVLIGLTVDNLDAVFKHLSPKDEGIVFLSRHKARNWERRNHDSWLRIYALRLEGGVYVITGGAIKMSQKMQDDPETKKQLQKINECKAYLKGLIYDVEGLEELIDAQN